MYDVIVIGAGVSGTAVARELMRHKRKVAVLEKASDVCEGTSKANSGIVHAGYDAKPGSLKAELNVKGSKMMEALSNELDFPYQKNGSIVLCFNENDKEKLYHLYDQGIKNGVENLEVVDKSKLKILEPNVSDNAVAALYAPEGGIVCPFNLNIAMAENAFTNGAEFYFNSEVCNIQFLDNLYTIQTTDGRKYETKIIVNAAGVYADKIHSMVSKIPMHITARKGEYCLMDKKVGKTVSHTLFQLPTELGKGVLVTPTVHGNLLIGPTAVDTFDKEATDTTLDGLDSVLKRGALSINKMPERQIITSFAGLRAHEDGGDFIIREADDAKGFIDVAGIESPGLTCAPAIGQYVAELIQKKWPAQINEEFSGKREGIPSDTDTRIICRCEMVTEGQIINAIKRPLGATTVDGVKRRTRAGMGRCQSGFCLPKTIAILSRELGIPEEEITKCGGKSKYLEDGGDQNDK